MWRFGVEPTVRIGWSKSDFGQKSTQMPKQTQLTLPLQLQTRANPITEGFTERDMKLLEQLFVMDTS